MLYAYGNVPLSQKLLMVRDRAKERSMAIELLFRRDFVKISVTTKNSNLVVKKGQKDFWALIRRTVFEKSLGKSLKHDNLK